MNGLQVTRQLVFGTFLAILMLGGAFGGAAANVIVSQSEYVDICKGTGGTPSRVATNVVKCTNGNVTSTCNFKTKKCKDVVVERRSIGGELGGGLTTGEVVAQP